jgi:hypothetical protein
MARASVAMPAGSNWRLTGGRTYRFRDPTGRPDGVRKAFVRSGDGDFAIVLVTGHGSNLPDAIVPPLALPVVVQMSHEGDHCVSAVYDSDDVIKNDDKVFKARSKATVALPEPP